MHPLDAQVVALPWTQHETMTTERHGPRVDVLVVCSMCSRMCRAAAVYGRERDAALIEVLAADAGKLLPLAELAADLHSRARALPKMLATAASAASRPVPIRTRPFRWARRVASKTTQLPPMKHSKQA